MFQNSDELLKYVKDEGVEMVDVRFCDLPGVMQHVTIPANAKPDTYKIRANSIVGGQTYDQTMYEISYPHIQTHRRYAP